METDKDKREEEQPPPQESPISEFVSGLAKLGQERQGIGYTICLAPPVKTDTAH
jgi:hypothetical protein